jgi:hypothetical protein
MAEPAAAIAPGLLQQLQQVDTAYTNAKAAGSPDADQLASMARDLAQQIQSYKATVAPPAPVATPSQPGTGSTILDAAKHTLDLPINVA